MKTEKTALTRAHISSFFKAISEYTIYLIIVLLPIIFLPFTSDYFEFNKSIIFIVLTLLAFVCWIFSTDNKNPISIWKSHTERPILVLLGSLVLPTIFSQHFLTSILGFSATLSNSVTFTIILVIFGFTARNVLTSKTKITNLVWIIAGTGAVMSIITILQYWGVFVIGKIDILRFTTYRTFTTLGYNSVLPFYFTALIPFVVYLLFKEKRSKVAKFLAGLISITVLYGFTIVVKNFWTWPGIILFPLAIASTWFQIKKSEIKPNLRVERVILFVIPLLIALVVHNIPSIENKIITTQADIGSQPRLSFSTTIKTIGSQFSESPKEIILGGGPDTFAYTFSKHKPASHSSSDTSGIRFSKSPYQITDIISNTGLVGLAGWIVFGYFIVLMIKKIWSLKYKTTVSFLLNTFCVDILILLIFSMFTSYTTVMWMLLWISLGVLSVLYLLHCPEEAEKVSLSLIKNSENQKSLSNFIRILSVSILIGVTFMLTRIYIAEVHYRMAEITINQDAENDSEKIINHIQANNYLTTAIENFGSRDDYYSDRAITAIDLLEYYSNFNESDSSDSDREQIQLLATDSLISAINLNHINVRNYKAAVYVYETLLQITEGEYGTELIGSINSALVLDPNDPELHHKRGVVLYLSGNDGAVEEIEKSIELDPIYIPARFDLITLYQEEGNSGQAQEELETIIEIMEEYNLDSTELYTSLVQDLENFKQGIIPDTYRIGELDEEIDETSEQIEETETTE